MSKELKDLIRMKRKYKKLRIDLAKTLISKNYVSLEWAKKNILNE